MAGKSTAYSIELVTEEHQQENPLHQLLEGDLRQAVMDAIESLPEREQLVPTAVLPEELQSQRDWRGIEVGESRVSQRSGQAIKTITHQTG